MNDIVPGSYGLRILGDFWKKNPVSWDLKLDEASWFLDLGEASPVMDCGVPAFVGSVSWDLKLDEVSWFLDLGEASPVMDYGIPARCWVRWKSQHNKNCFSLSSCRKPKSQEGSKGFVSELKKVVSVSGFLCICMGTFYVSEYLTYHILNML